MSKARGYFFTVNNYTEADQEAFDKLECRYVVVGKEVGESGTPHLQAFVLFNSPRSFEAIKKLFPRAHIEVAKDSYASMKYCKKEGEWKERGEPPKTKAEGGETTKRKWDDAYEAAKEGRLEDIPAEFKWKFAKRIEEIRRENQPKVEDKDFVPRAWQKNVMEAVSTQADDRRIYWVTDTEGNKGKSRLTRHLVCELGGILLQGRMADMTYQLSQALDSKAPPKIVVFDVSRAAAEYSDHLYSMAEMVKNGFFVSTKYESRQVVFKPLHVVFFSNQSWDRTKFSLDRVKEMNLTAGENTFPM